MGMCGDVANSRPPLLWPPPSSLCPTCKQGMTYSEPLPKFGLAMEPQGAKLVDNLHIGRQIGERMNRSTHQAHDSRASFHA